MATIQQKFDQLVANIPDQAVEVSDKSNAYQCMDWAYLWTFILGYPKATIQRLYAYEVFTKANDLTKQYFDVIPNTPDFVPQLGDLGVFGTDVGTAGHICVCTGKGDTNSFQSRDQNWAGKAAVVEIRHTYGGKNYFLGVLRPKVFDSECIIMNDELGKKRYTILAHNSDIADKVVRKLELGPDANNVEFDTIEKSLAARDGKLTTCTTSLSTREAELAKANAEVLNRGEQVGRLKVQLTEKEIAHLAEITALKQTIPNVDDATAPLKAQIERLQSDFTAEAKLKGAALANLAECQKQLEIAQKGAIGTISFAQWLKLLGSVKW